MHEIRGKNDAAVDRMCASIREFGFKIPVLARSNGEVVDGHLRLKPARKAGITEVPVILCDEWTPAQVKAFRLMVNRSVTWADRDDELLAPELQDLQDADYDLDLTGFDPHEIDTLLALDDEEKANAAPPLPESPVSRPGDLWLLGQHRVLCGDSTSAETIARLLGERKPRLMMTDPPYGIELDSEWRDRAALNGCGPAEPSYMKRRTKGHTETTISGDTWAGWSEAFALVPCLEVAYVWHASKFTREVLDGLLRNTPPYQIRARTEGEPALGSGAIYPIDESEITVPDRPIPDDWPRAFGMDVGWNRTAVVWGARDPGSGVIYLYSEHYQGQGEPASHAQAIRGRGSWIPGVIDPRAWAAPRLTGGP